MRMLSSLGLISFASWARTLISRAGRQWKAMTSAKAVSTGFCGEQTRARTIYVMRLVVAPKLCMISASRARVQAAGMHTRDIPSAGKSRVHVQ